MQRLFITALACLISGSVFGQIFEIKVEEMFSKPDYLAINQNSDVLNLVGTINGSFQREGFNVVNANWARQALQNPKPKPNIQKTALEVFNLIERSSSVDPSLRTIKRTKLISLAKDAGIGNGIKTIIEKGIEECISQGALVVLPKKMIAISNTRKPPIVEEIIEEKWNQPIIYEFKFNYVYRDSFSCGRTIKELYASLNDMSDGTQLASIRFEQPALSSMCKQEIINKCISKLMSKNHHEFKFQKSPNYIDLKSIAILGKDGQDCRGKSSQDLANDFSSGILQLYNVVDRSNLDIFIEEQRNSMSGLFEDSDYIEAGRLAGAEGIVFVSATCKNKHTEIDITLSDTSSGSIQWSIHSENIDPHDLAKRLTISMTE